MPHKTPADLRLSRRHMILGASATALAFRSGIARAATAAAGPPPALVERARAALSSAIGNGLQRDMIGLVDFSAPSSAPRFYLLDPLSGQSRALLVAHGRGSDPGHSGWLQRFSNLPGSNASSAGAYRTGDVYVGKHGRSRRLIGLEPENDNARSRAIVVHAASYVSDDLARNTGKIGRSEGCFAVAQDNIDHVLARLGSNRLLFAGKA